MNTLPLLRQARPHSTELSGKRARGGRRSTSLLPKSLPNKALSAVSVRINRCKRSTLVDTWYTQTLVRKACCNAWEKKKVPVLTVSAGSLVCYGESIVHISVSDGPPVAVQALVMDGELLGYDLLLGMDSITQLGGITVNSTGNIRFSRREKHVCAAITLDEPDFHTEYDRHTNAWTASWKWLSEYPSPM